VEVAERLGPVGGFFSATAGAGAGAGAGAATGTVCSDCDTSPSVSAVISLGWWGHSPSSPPSDKTSSSAVTPQSTSSSSPMIFDVAIELVGFLEMIFLAKLSGCKV
jgi:hypothetical protein